MNYSSEIIVECKDNTDADNIVAMLSHEGRGGSERANSEIKKIKNKVIIRIFAKDATALRAFINSFLRDFQAIEGVVNDL